MFTLDTEFRSERRNLNDQKNKIRNQEIAQRKHRYRANGQKLFRKR